jgi:16S rRNA (guanine527-N7)-methyltransferase
VPSALTAALERAQRLGLLGPGPVAAHVEHAEALAQLVDPPASFLDLGSGGGIPGLVLALRWPVAQAALLDSAQRRAEHLQAACAELGLVGRVSVIAARAEDAARDERWRGAFELVVARSFGPPAVTAECAVGFLAAGGSLVVSEPPGGAPGRWDPAGLSELGLGGPEIVTAGQASCAVFTLAEAAAMRWPRRTGVPERRPLWRA